MSQNTFWVLCGEKILDFMTIFENAHDSRLIKYILKDAILIQKTIFKVTMH